MSFKKKKPIYSVVVLLLIILQLLNVYNWYQKKQLPIGKDYIEHLRLTSKFLKEIPNYNIKEWKKFVFISINDNPPLYYWTATILYVLSNQYNAVFFNSTIYLVILLLSVYGIGKEIKDEEAGLLAALICSLFPYIYFTSIQYNLELATAAMVALIIYLIILTREFSDKFYIILFGIALVLGSYTRQLVLVYVLSPILVLMVKIIKAPDLDEKTKKIRLVKFVMVMGICFFISLPYYHVLSPTHHMIKKMSITGWAFSENLFSFEHLSFYIRALPVQLGLFFSVVFLVAILFSKRVSNPVMRMFLIWFMPPLIIMSFVFLKFYVYTIANLPVIALFISQVICSIKNDRLRKYLALGVVIIGFFGYFKNFPW